MLALIFTDRYLIRLVEQNIRRHQHGIGKDSNTDSVIPHFLGLIFELSHPSGFANASQAFHHPAELIMGGDMGLNKESALGGVDAQRNELCQRSERALMQVFWIWL